MFHMLPTKMSSFHQRKKTDGQRHGRTTPEQVIPLTSAAEPFFLGFSSSPVLALWQGNAGTSRNVKIRSWAAGLHVYVSVFFSLGHMVLDFIYKIDKSHSNSFFKKYFSSFNYMSAKVLVLEKGSRCDILDITVLREGYVRNVIER